MFHLAPLVGFLLLTASAASADTLVLANGDAISGEIVEWAVDHVVLEHPQLGQVRLTLDQLKLDTGEPPNPGLLGTSFLRGWRRRIDLGLTGKKGNSESTVITGGLNLAYEDDWTRWNLDGRSFYNRDEDGVSDNNARVELRRDWRSPDSRWFWTLGSRYQFDEFEAWEHRLATFTGPGFNLFRSDAHRVDIGLGPAFTREFGEKDDNKFESLFNLDYDWTISERSSLSFRNGLFVEIQPDEGALRNFTRTQWSLSLTERPALSLNVGVENEYESRPEPGDDRNDLKYYLSIGLDL